MRKTSEYHGYQVKIIAGFSDYLYQNAKVYKTRASAQKAIAKIVNGIDSGLIKINEFQYCEIVDWFA